ncbi:MAG: hypothetical protein Q4D60_10675 [Eubacteriales bacterium]|nr:hypothetical protein [Eubacteriales bacterium]
MVLNHMSMKNDTENNDCGFQELHAVGRSVHAERFPAENRCGVPDVPGRQF